MRPGFLPSFAVESMVRFFPPIWVPASSTIFVPVFFFTSVNRAIFATTLIAINSSGLQ